MASTTIRGFSRTVAVTVVPGHTPPGSVVIDGMLDASGAALLSVRHVSADLVTNDDVTDGYEITALNTLGTTGGATPDAPDSDGDFLVVTYARPAAA
jgi:hypothetical protein